METFAIGAALVIWFGYTAWAYVELKAAKKYNDTLISDCLALREEKASLIRAAAKTRKEAATLPAVIAPPTDEQCREHKRRWHERQAIDKALKWDDSWGPL